MRCITDGQLCVCEYVPLCVRCVRVCTCVFRLFMRVRSFVCACVYMCISTFYASMFLCVCVRVHMFLNIRVLQKSLTAGTWRRERAVVRNMHMVSFAKEPYNRVCILQKRPVVLRSLLIVATPYVHSCVRVCTCIFKYPSVTEKSDGRWVHCKREYACTYICVCVSDCV